MARVLLQQAETCCDQAGLLSAAIAAPDREAFQTCWREQHAPLAARHAEVLGILRYPQNHMAHDELIAELWFESEAALAAIFSEAAAKAGAELLEDERKSIDLANSPLWFGDEWEEVT